MTNFSLFFGNLGAGLYPLILSEKLSNWIRLC
jgi:hypothetical protein